MNDVLVDILRDRAEQAPDSDAMWEDILHGIDARRGRRRATMAAAGASVAVAAAAVTAVAVVPSRSHHRASVPVGAPPRPASTATEPARTAVHLVAVKPAPAEAKLALGVAPEGWIYVDSNPASTTYSDHGGSSEDFATRLVVMLDASGQAQHPLRIGGHPAAITKSDGYTSVELVLGAKRYLVVQVPPQLSLNQQQLTQLAGSATVRSGAVAAQG